MRARSAMVAHVTPATVLGVSRFAVIVNNRRGVPISSIFIVSIPRKTLAATSMPKPGHCKE